jgi:RNA polymerase sigma-70 factor, ECF subfamily
MHDLALPQIIEKAVAGDMHAFRILVERHQRFVYSLSYRFLGSKGDAEDITQETFIRLWKHLKRYKPEIKLTTWLYKITTNLCLDVLKSRRWKQIYQTQSIEHHHEFAGPDLPDVQMLNEELKIILLKMAEVLTPKQKAVFLLRDVEGLEVSEVCDILSMSAGNVKSNLYYSRTKMGELIKQYYSEYKTGRS